MVIADKISMQHVLLNMVHEKLDDIIPPVICLSSQHFDRALRVSRKAAESLRDTQELVMELEHILQQEEQTADKLVKSSSKEQESPAVDRSPAFSNQDGTNLRDPVHTKAGPAAPASAPAPAAAAGGPFAASDDCTQRASDSLDMLQRLLPQLESAGTLPPPPPPLQESGGGADHAADIDCQ